MSARVFVDLLIFGVRVAARQANERPTSQFTSSLQTPEAGALIREHGTDKAARIYALRQGMDPWLFPESLGSVIGSSKPTSAQVATVIGGHRRRWQGRTR
jgi:hypothetical protein